MIPASTLEAIEASDTDQLLRAVDGLCAGRAWDDLIELRARCREAVGRGKQVWGVEEHIRYRVALEAPPDHAGPMVSEGESRFALGPLAEVAASTKTWAEIQPYLEPGPERLTVAAERVIRGEIVEVSGLELPANLEAWEPEYQVATYHRDRVETPTPGIPGLLPVELPERVEVLDDPASEGALADLVLPWTDESNGRCQTVTVEGDHLAAIRALGAGSARVAELAREEGLGWMGWAAASGGAHGRRRGAAAGRYLTWWVISVLADIDWPAVPGQLARAVDRFRWHWFDDGSPGTGWAVRLTVTDPEEDMSWAISAIDSV